MAGSWFRRQPARPASAVLRPYEIQPILQPEGGIVHPRFGLDRRTTIRTPARRVTLAANSITGPVGVLLDSNNNPSLPIGDLNDNSGANLLQSPVQGLFFPNGKEGILHIYSLNINISPDSAETPAAFTDILVLEAILQIVAINEPATADQPVILYSNDAVSVTGLAFTGGINWDNLPDWRSDDFQNVQLNTTAAGVPVTPNITIPNGIKNCFFQVSLTFKNSAAATIHHVNTNCNVTYDIFDWPRQ